jgi:hypothetical protein
MLRLTIQLGSNSSNQLIIGKVHSRSLLTNFSDLLDNAGRKQLVLAEDCREVFNHGHDVVQIRLMASWSWVTNHAAHAHTASAIHAIGMVHALRRGRGSLSRVCTRSTSGGVDVVLIVHFGNELLSLFRLGRGFSAFEFLESRSMLFESRLVRVLLIFNELVYLTLLLGGR